MTKARKAILAVAAILTALAGAVVVLPPLLWGDGVDYSHAVSIKTTREYQDPTLIAEAWALPVAATYRAGFESQGNPSFCGPTSIVDVLHSLGLGGEQDTVLQGTGDSTVFGLLLGGLSIDRVADVARKRLGRTVTVLRDLDLPAFRDHMRRTNDPARRYTVNFSRGPLFGTGGGHHSPIAGYLEAEDLVFVLDVNRKYGPWLVKTDRLYEAVNTVDPGTHLKRGLLLVQ